jgi:hypothetical protein
VDPECWRARARRRLWRSHHVGGAPFGFVDLLGALESIRNLREHGSRFAAAVLDGCAGVVAVSPIYKYIAVVRL